ncbi:MAG: pirin family protein [Bacteroidota bacterium]
MKRKHFLRNTLLGMAGVAAGKTAFSNTPQTSTYDRLKEQVGFNHLPENEERTMKTVLHKANTRGHANHGWLNSHHSFSFARYYNPERMNFGVLRVLNDDTVTAAKGFGTHPHDNMEIISIPLSGDLEHKDSMGNTTIIKEGDVQVMSAGTGVYHSEYNKNDDQEVKFLQIWMFPNQKNVKPRYDQITLEEDKMKNQLLQVLSPNKDDDGVWVHQNAWFHLGNLFEGTQIEYNLKARENGVYAFILEGDVKIGDQTLNPRDGYGIWDTESVSITASSDARILLMDVPMQV